MKRRALFRALVAAPVALAVPSASSADYAAPREVFEAADRAEAEVELRLRALSEAVPAARALTRSLLRDLERHRAERDQMRRRLGLPAGVPVRTLAANLVSLRALRTAQEALVEVHVEGLPALGDAAAVDRLARHMVELSRHLTVVELWIEAEESRG